MTARRRTEQRHQKNVSCPQSIPAATSSNRNAGIHKPLVAESESTHTGASFRMHKPVKETDHESTRLHRI